MKAVFGRVETIDVSGKPVSILLIKNPAGANEVLRTLTLESSNGGIDLWIALNDRIADGRDVSWIWDADFELLSSGVHRVICAGTRAPEMALRLKYAGWPEDAIEVMSRSRAPWTRPSRPPRTGSSPSPPTPPCSSSAPCSPIAASRLTTGNDFADRLAGGRVRLLRRRPARLGGARRSGRWPGRRARSGCRPSRIAPGRARARGGRSGARSRHDPRARAGGGGARRLPIGGGGRPRLARRASPAGQPGAGDRPAPLDPDPR